MKTIDICIIVLCLFMAIFPTSGYTQHQETSSNSLHDPFFQLGDSTLAKQNLVLYSKEDDHFATSSTTTPDILMRVTYEGTNDSTVAFSLGNVVTFTTDLDGENFYYYDSHREKIYWSDPDFTQREEVVSRVKRVEDMAYDHNTGYLYYTQLEAPAGIYRVRRGDSSPVRYHDKFVNFLQIDAENNLLFYNKTGDGIIKHNTDMDASEVLISFTPKTQALHFDHTNNRILYISSGDMYGYTIDNDTKTKLFPGISDLGLEWHTTYDASRDEYYMGAPGYSTYRIPLANLPAETELSIPSVDHTRTLSFNHSNDRLYLSGYDDNFIGNTRLFAWNPDTDKSNAFSINFMQDFTIDSRGTGTVYVLDAHPVGTETMIHRMDLVGKNKEIVAYIDDIIITELVLDTTNNQLYWSGFNRADKTPFGRTDLTTFQSTILEDYSDFGSTQMKPIRALEVDPVNERLYYTSSQEGIMECDLDMNTCEQLTTVTDELTRVLTIDPIGQRLYFFSGISLKYYDLQNNEVQVFRDYNMTTTLPNVVYNLENNSTYIAQGTFTMMPDIYQIKSDESLVSLFRRDLTNFDIHIGDPDVTTSFEEQFNTVPEIVTLKQNYPNPFNPNTVIDYHINKSGMVTLEIYDMLGRKVATLVDQPQISGNHSIQFNASALSSGTYIYRLQTKGTTLTRTFTLIK